MTMGDVAPFDSLGFVGGVSVNGRTAPFTLPQSGDITALCNVTAITGSSPAVQVFLEMTDAQGNWNAVVTLPSQNATGVQQASAQVPGNLSRVARLRWALTGTSPIATIAAFAAATG